MEKLSIPKRKHQRKIENQDALAKLKTKLSYLFTNTQSSKHLCPVSTVKELLMEVELKMEVEVEMQLTSKICLVCQWTGI